MQHSSSSRLASKPKRILLIRNAFTYDFGGAERLAVHLASELRTNGYEAAIVSRQPKLLAYAAAQGVPARRGWWWSRQNWSGKRVVLVPLYIGWQLLLVVWYLRLFMRGRPDVIHAMSKDDFIAATVAGRLLGKRIIWTDTADLKHVFRHQRVWYRNPVGKLVFAASKLAQAVCLVSFSERRAVEAALGQAVPDNYLVMQIGSRQQTPATLPRATADEDAVIFCSTSRLVRDKGIAELILAFAELSRQSHAYRLWLIGDGNDRAEFEQLAGGYQDIVFFGHRDNPLDYVQAADIFVLPTYHEGFSLSLTEAAMLGKPMIATDVGGNPEIVNARNGLLVEAKNVPGLSAAMSQLAQDRSLRQHLGAQAARDYERNFNFSEVVKHKLMPLYE